MKKNIIKTITILATAMVPCLATTHATTPKLRKRGMTTTQTGENTVPSVGTDGHDENDTDEGASVTRELKAAAPAPVGCGCNGNYYYQHMWFPEPSTWTTAYAATPDGCVLAPVGSWDELQEIAAVVPPEWAWPWIGIVKNAGQAKRDNAPDADEDAPITGWKNLDGSLVPVDRELWAENEPGNAYLPENRAFFSGKGLSDMMAAGKSTSAVYKCCGENVSTCRTDRDALKNEWFDL